MFFKLYLITLPIFFTIDLIWLGLVAKNFYSRHIGFLMKTDVNWPAAFCFYFLFILGLVVFVIRPALLKNSLQEAVLLGALFGLISYATYDLTNLATLKDWPLTVTIVDLIWGMVLSSVVSVLSYIAAQKFGI